MKEYEFCEGEIEETKEEFLARTAPKKTIKDLEDIAHHWNGSDEVFVGGDGCMHTDMDAQEASEKLDELNSKYERDARIGII